MTPVLFALLNRARGSKLFGLTTSTTVARIVSTVGMALLTYQSHPTLGVLLWSFASLFFWQVFGWGKYFAAIHGNIDPKGGGMRWVDWLMDRLDLPTFTVEERKRWGTVAMGLRQTLLAPFVLGLAYLTDDPGMAWLAVFTPFLGIPYYLAGKISQKYAGLIAELIIGALIGAIVYK